MVRVGFIGDVVGSPGREILRDFVRIYREKFSIDFIVANCENASGGFGLGAKNAMEIFSYGIDVISGGNHSFDKKDIIPLMSELPIIRPFNHYNAPGSGVMNLGKDGKDLSVINLLGIMGANLARNIFLCFDEALGLCKSKNILVDLHAEMTSEKMAFLWENRGRVSAILGTHTHVGTDDLKISNGTIFVSDVGLSGAREGVIGMDGDISVAGFKSGLKQSFKVNKSYKKIFQMIVFDLEEGRCVRGFKLKLIDNKEIISEAYYD